MEEFCWERRERLARELAARVATGRFIWVNGRTGYYLRRCPGE